MRLQEERFEWREFGEVVETTPMVWYGEKNGGEVVNEVVNIPSEGSEPINEPINEGIKLEPGINKPGLIKKLGKSRATVKRAVAELIAAGKIEHRGSKKTGGYYLKEGEK